MLEVLYLAPVMTFPFLRRKCTHTRCCILKFQHNIINSEITVLRTILIGWLVLIKINNLPPARWSSEINLEIHYSRFIAPSSLYYCAVNSWRKWKCTNSLPSSKKILQYHGWNRFSSMSKVLDKISTERLIRPLRQGGIYEYPEPCRTYVREGLFLSLS